MTKKKSLFSATVVSLLRRDLYTIVCSLTYNESVGMLFRQHTISTAYPVCRKKALEDFLTMKTNDCMNANWLFNFSVMQMKSCEMEKESKRTYMTRIS